MSDNELDVFDSLTKALRGKIKIIESKNAKIEKLQALLLAKNQPQVEDEFCIYSSDMDKEAVSTIQRDFDDFGQLACDYGYQLIVKQEMNRGVGIYLSDFEGNGNLKETVKELQKLVVSKQILDEERAEDTEIPTRRVVPTIKIMAKELENLMNVTNDIQNIISKQKIEEGEKNEKDALRFYDELINMYTPKSFDLLRNSDMIVNLCEEILESKKDEESEKWEVSKIPTMYQMKEEILKVLNHLETGKHVFNNRPQIQEEIIFFISVTISESFLSTANKKETKKMKKHYKQKYEMEDTIGYVHIHREKIGPFELFACFAICDGKIVGLSINETLDVSLNDLKRQLNDKLESNCKLAINVEGDLPDMFVYTSNNEVFNEHKELVETIEQFCTVVRKIYNVLSSSLAAFVFDSYFGDKEQKSANPGSRRSSSSSSST